MPTLQPSDLRTASKNKVKFNHTQKLSQSITTLKTSPFRPAHKSISTPRTKTSKFRSQHYNEVKFDPHTTIKLISTPPRKSSQFDPHYKMRSISIPPLKNQVNFDPHTTTKHFSTTQKPSQFRSQRQSQVNFDSHHKIKPVLMPRYQNQVNFDLYT